MVSHEHKVVFVHIPKCAGQSIEQLFLDALGLHWEQRSALLLAPNTDPASGPERLAHLYAHEYVDCGHVSQQQFDTYLRFAVVRDPAARLVSALNFAGVHRRRWWRRRGWARVEDYVMAMQARGPRNDAWRHVCPQVNYLYHPDTGEQLVDRILRFEHLQQEFCGIARMLFEEDRVLPRRNSNTTVEWQVKLLTADDRAFIADFYAEDYRFLAELP